MIVIDRVYLFWSSVTCKPCQNETRLLKSLNICSLFLCRRAGTPQFLGCALWLLDGITDLHVSLVRRSVDTVSKLCKIEKGSVCTAFGTTSPFLVGSTRGCAGGSCANPDRERCSRMPWRLAACGTRTLPVLLSPCLEPVSSGESAMIWNQATPSAKLGRELRSAAL